MTTAIEDPAGAPPVRPDDRRSSWPTRLAIFAIVAVTVSPIVVAALSLIGDAWYPVGDLSHIYFRVGQVGTRSTPLVGAETIKGWAHPGPAEFWLAAPLYRLTGEDARSLMWTAATINVVAVAGIAAVAWRRGGFPLLLGLMAMVGVLIHTLGPERVTSIWNPFLPLLPFLLGASSLLPAMVISLLALFACGAVVSRVTTRTWWFGGLRQLILGGAAAGLTYLIGHAVGASVS